MAKEDDVIAVLSDAASNGDIGDTKWPDLLDSMLDRLDDIVKNTFPIPTIPPHLRPSPFPTQLSSEIKVEVKVEPSQAGSQKTEPLTPISSQLDKELPSQLQALYDSLKANLNSNFSQKPPYTIQRLAELLLHPQRHYKTLPAFLRAVDRVILVSSTTDVFPLPFTTLESNGVLGVGQDDFNGAALEPIPWATGLSSEYPRDTADLMSLDNGTDLRTESTSMVVGPNGAGSIETVTVGTNGDVTNGIDTFPTDSSNGSTESLFPSTEPSEIAVEDDGKEEKPHARGPEEIGMEDMGPQATALSNEPGPADSIQAAERAVGRPGEGERVVEEEHHEVDTSEG